MAKDVDYEDTLPPVEEALSLWSGTVKTKFGKGISLWPEPVNTGKAVAKILEGAIVDIMADMPDDGYIEARYGRSEGYVNLTYIVPPDGEAPAQETHRAIVVDVDIGLNLRSSPERIKDTILLIPPGKEVEVFPEKQFGEFAYVLYAGRAGYCTAGKLRPVKESVS